MPLTIKDALRLAAKDKRFAHELVTDPASLQAHFHLTEKQIEQLKKLGATAKLAGPDLGVGQGFGPAASYE